MPIAAMSSESEIKFWCRGREEYDSEPFTERFDLSANSERYPITSQCDSIEAARFLIDKGANVMVTHSEIIPIVFSHASTS